jgi:2-isopropylmalate synthase
VFAYRLDKVNVVCGNQQRPTATVGLVDSSGVATEKTTTGTGPVDAVCKAIDGIVKLPMTLTEFSVSSVTEGIDALGEVTIRVERDGQVYTGRGSSTDIVVASANAYVNAINRMLMIVEQDELQSQKRAAALR